MTTCSSCNDHQGRLGVVIREKTTCVPIDSMSSSDQGKASQESLRQPQDIRQKPHTTSTRTQISSIIRRLALYLLRPLRYLDHSLFRPNMNRTRHHLLGQARQTPASDTDALDAIASMHEPRSAIVAEVASHSFSRRCRPSVLAQGLRI